MALKKKIKSLDEVPESLRTEYKESNGEYVLDVEGEEDIGALLRAKEHEKNLRKEAEKKLRDNQLEVAQLEKKIEELELKPGNNTDLEKKYQEKINKINSESEQARKSLEGELQRLLVDNVARTLAEEISVSPSIIIPHIQKRLMTVEKDGKYVTAVKDEDGGQSALTIDELKNSFITNKEFAPIIKGSKGSGGGANNNPNGGGNGKSKPDFLKASPKEIAEYLKNNRNGE